MDWSAETSSLGVPVAIGAGMADVLRRAVLLIDRYGANAEIHIAMRVDELLDAGDLDGARAWRRVLAALDELRRTCSPPGATWH